VTYALPLAENPDENTQELSVWTFVLNLPSLESLLEKLRDSLKALISTSNCPFVSSF